MTGGANKNRNWKRDDRSAGGSLHASREILDMFRTPHALSPIVATGALVLASTLAHAQEPTEEALRKRIEELEHKLERLEQRLEQPGTTTLTESPAAPVTEPSARETALQERVESLDQEVKVLGRKQELEREAAAAKANADTGTQARE